MRRIKLVFILCFIFTFLGCAAVKKSIDNYEACKGDPVCFQQMSNAQQVSYTATKTVANAALPSSSEVIALIVSNVVAFGVGVWKGKKKVQ